MKYEQMKQTLDDVALIEQDLMRDLTSEEKDAIVEKGWRRFLVEDVKLDDTNFKLFKEVKEFFSTFFTMPDGDYSTLINSASPELGLILRNLGKDILNEGVDCFNNLKSKKESNPVEDAIEKLKSGSELELDPEVIDKVVDKLWSTEDNIRIEVRNNKIRLR